MVIHAVDEKITHQTPTRTSTFYLWYLGFAAQLPWTTILVYLPVLESVLGGVLFSFAVGIAMGLACNIVRFLVVVFGRKFTFTIRVYYGSCFSALFTLGYFVIYLVPVSVDSAAPTGAESIGFWMGLLVALLGGAGNAQLMSTGYGVASIVSVERPIGNSLFFFGQAAAAACCWPVKRLIETMTSDETVQIGLAMIAIAIISLSVIPVFLVKIQRMTGDDDLRTANQTLSWENARKILTNAWLPYLCLWMTYFCTNLVTPGQLTVWSLPVTTSSSAYLTDPKMYRSLCSYTHLLSDAVGKSIPVLVSANPERIRRLMSSKWAPVSIAGMTICRLGLLVLFFLPPLDVWSRFSFLTIFGLLNGVLASVCLSLSTFRADKKDKDIAGYINSFIIINGLFIGSLIGMLVRVAQ